MGYCYPKRGLASFLHVGATYRCGVKGRHRTSVTARALVVRSRMLVSLALVAALGGTLVGLAPTASAAQAGAVGSVPIAGGASGVAVAGNVVAVTSAAARTVSVVDAATLTVRSSTPLPLVPTEVVLSPDGSLAFVLAKDAAPSPTDPPRYGIYVVDAATGALLRSSTYEGVNGSSTSGPMTLRDLAISPNGGRLDVVAEGGGTNAEVWSIDPATLAVGTKVILLSGFLSGVGRPIGSMASFDDRLLTMAYVQVFKCPDMDGCPQPDAIVTVSGGSVGTLENGPVQIGVTMVRDPSDGTVLSPTPTTTWMEFNPLPGAQSLVRFDPVTGVQRSGKIDGLGTKVSTLGLDSGARHLYGMRESGRSIAVMDMATSSVLGELNVVSNHGFAVGNGRVYLATDAGLEVIDPSRVLAPSVPKSIKVKLSPAGKGKVRATITFKPPASQGSAAVTGYRIEALSQDPALQTPIRGTAKCSTRKTSCTVTLPKVVTSDDLFPAMYTVSMRAVNANGLGAVSELSVRAN